MSFERFNRGSGFRVQGLSESIRAIDNILRSWNNTKVAIYQEAGTEFVNNAKRRVHKVSHTLERNISIESISPLGVIVSARTRYALTEESRPGNKPGINTPHTFMKPAAEDTNKKMPNIIKKRLDAFFAANKTL